LGHKFRKAFVAEKDYNLLSLDYSQMELRIVAHISEDENLIEAFKKDEDIHTHTASQIFKLPKEEITPEIRRRAKVLNFGIIYGMGPQGFARSAGITQKEAKEFIEKYFKEFQKVAQYMDKIREEAHQKGLVKTIFGRYRLLPEIYSSNPELVRQAERMAINFPIQGTASDLMKMAMIKISEYIHQNYNNLDIKILLQVHDELLFEVKEKLTKKLAKELKEIMENIYKLKVPLKVEAKFGKNWKEMEKI